MGNCIRCFIFFTILILPIFVFAEEKTAEFSVTPFVGLYVFDDDLYLENKMGYGVRMGYNRDKNWGVEGSLGYVQTELTSETVLLYEYLGIGLLGLDPIELADLDPLLELYTGAGGTPDSYDVDEYNYNLDVLYHFYPEKKLVPFVCAGAGGTTIKYPEGIKDKNEFSLNCGAGVKYFVNDKVAVRCDARNITMIEGPNTEEFKNIQEYSAGISLLFGGEKETVSEPAVLDSDGDGVPDYLDQCPDTPRGVAVDKRGCPLDSDSDGVPDYLDRCPDTPKGAKVDERGCWSFQADNVLFEFDKYKLKPQAHPILDEVVVILKRDKDLRIEVRGHTCNVGTEEYNKKLSEKRARAVAEYLLNKGIDPKRLNFSGYGETMPAYSNKAEEGRSLNRRVEFITIKAQPYP